MLKVRLQRFGAKRKPTYRIVVADARAKRDGRFIEIVGHYNPRTEPTTLHINEERARYWLGQGAQPTDRVIKLLRIQGIPIPGKLASRPPETATSSAGED